MKRTLYVDTPGTVLRRDGGALVIERDDRVLERVPVHRLERLMLWGGVQITTPALRMLVEGGTDVALLGERGLIGAIRAPVSGGLFSLLAQVDAFRSPQRCLALARAWVEAKCLAQAELIAGARRAAGRPLALPDGQPLGDAPGVGGDWPSQGSGSDPHRLPRAAGRPLALPDGQPLGDAPGVDGDRPSQGSGPGPGPGPGPRRLPRTPADVERSQRVADLRGWARRAAEAGELESLRGIEGQAARTYFAALGLLVRPPFVFEGRNRRPPRDPVNALLSLGYMMLATEIRADIEARGLDPRLGFFHVVRAGRPALALDLMEPWRAPVVDRLVLTVLNRGQFKPEDFEAQADGGVRLVQKAFAKFIAAWEGHLGGREPTEAGELPGLRRQMAAWLDGFEDQLVGGQP